MRGIRPLVNKIMSADAAGCQPINGNAKEIETLLRFGT